MEKLKIGLVFDDSLDRNDGVQQYVKTLGSWLSEQKHEVHYLVGQSDSPDEHVHSLSRNLNVSFNGNRLSTPIKSDSQAIAKLIEAEKFDVLHVQVPFSPVMASKVIRVAGAQTAVVGTFHVLPRGWFQKLTTRVVAFAQGVTMSRFDEVCAVSNPAAKYAKWLFDKEAEVIPCMIDARKWQTTETIRPGRLVFLGRLVERKGCQQLLEALENLQGDVLEGLEVIVAGDGPQRERLEAYAKSKKLPVEFRGYMEEEEKAPLLASAQLAVFPAMGAESFGIVLIEAMAAGAGVVVGGNNPGYSSVLGKWPETLVNPRDSEAFANSLTGLLTDKDKAESIHDQQQKAVANYDVNVVGQKIVDLYTKALLHRRR